MLIKETRAKKRKNRKETGSYVFTGKSSSALHGMIDTRCQPHLFTSLQYQNEDTICNITDLHKAVTNSNMINDK